MFSNKKFFSSLSLNINIKSEMKSFADDYVTDYDIRWPVFTTGANNRTVVQLALAASHPPLGCRAFISCTNFRYAFWVTMHL